MVHGPGTVKRRNTAMDKDFPGSGDAAAKAMGRVDRALAALVLAVFACLLAFHDNDPDLWGRMMYARDALAAGRPFLPTDPYSYTAAGHPWIDHEWGFNWIAWGTWRLGGWPALRLERIALAGATLLISLGWLRGKRSILTPPRTPSTFVPLAVFTIGAPLAIGFGGPRAQAVSFLFFAWMLLGIERSRRRDLEWMLIGVLPMPLWVNIHGGFLAGLGVLGIWGALRFVEAVRKREGQIIWVLFVCAALCVFSIQRAQPWGPDFIHHLLETARMERPYVGEWAAFDPLTFSGAFTMLLSGIALRTVILGPRPRLPEIAIVAVTACAAFAHHRHLPFLAIAVAIFVLPRAMEDRLARQFAPAPLTDRDRLAMRGMHAFLVAGALVAALLALRLSGRAAPAEPLFPARAVAWLESEGVTGNALVDFDWSQYLLFHRAPATRVAFDGRYETSYPDAIATQYWHWHAGEPGWRELLDDPRTDFVLLGAGSAREARITSISGWREVYRDPVAVIFLRESGRSPD